MRSGVDLGDETALSEVTAHLDVVFEDSKIRLGNEDVSDAIRAEACSNAASRIAAYPQVRQALLRGSARFAGVRVWLPMAGIWARSFFRRRCQDIPYCKCRDAAPSEDINS